MTRRERQVFDLAEIKEILDKAKIVHVGMVDGDRPYVVPMNYGYTLEDGKLTLEQVYEYGKTVGEPKQTSGKQELYEAIVAMYA